MALGCGLVSIFYSFHGDFVQAAWLIMLCVLLDKLDGTAARLLDAGSPLGIQLDSMADFVSFIIAPAIMYVALLSGDLSPLAGTGLVWTAYSSAVVYVVGGAVRLAGFNCLEQEEAGLKSYFRGYPTTLAGALLATLLPVVMGYSLLDHVARFLPVLLVLLAMLMVSGYYLPKLQKRRSRVVNWFTVVNVIVAPVLIVTRTLPEYLLFLVLLYTLVGFSFANRKGVEIT